MNIADRTEYRRIAVFGGVYKNAPALQATLEDARRREVEAVFRLGDMGGFGPHPDLVFPLLRDHRVPAIQGNYDESLASVLRFAEPGLAMEASPRAQVPVGTIGAALTCLVCLTPVAVLALGAIGLGAWTGHLDTVLLALLAGFVTLLVYRYWRTRRTPP